MKSQLIGKDPGAGKDGRQKNKEVVKDELQLIIVVVAVLLFSR